MVRCMSAVSELARTSAGMEVGDLMPLVVSVFLGVFIVSLIWTLSSDRRSEPPF